MSDITKIFSTKFSTGKNTFDPKFSSNTQKFDSNLRPNCNDDKDIWYDEIIFYDGGDEEGWLKQDT